MKKFTILLIIALFSISINAQERKIYTTEKVWRINFLNPAVELEFPTGNNSTFSSAIGIGYGGGYPDLTNAGTGFVYIISPFIDLQHKWFYNFEKRTNKGKSIINNSGNFVSARFIARGNSIAENVTRTSDYDFAFGPTWGFQRNYKNNFHLLFDIGPQYYFDTEGNGNIFPIVFQINLGFDL
tara:strand:- start:577 stop:1125 length:549 start_codon:yes stop_codon:yes gene_type:complete